MTTEPSHSREIFHKEHISTQSKFRVPVNITDTAAYKLKGYSSIVYSFHSLQNKTKQNVKSKVLAFSSFR